MREHVRESLVWLLQLSSGVKAAFAANAWDWIDEASACILAASQRLANTIDRIDIEILKARHKFELHNALAADRVPLELPQEACAQYIVEDSKSNLKKIFSKVSASYEGLRTFCI